jgi:hypothetical protein
MLDFQQIFEGGNAGLGAAILGFVILPAGAGIAAGVMAWRRKLGGVNVQRMLVQDDANGRPLWKVVARSIGRPIRRCRIRVGGKDLVWDGVNLPELDIGVGGMGIAVIPFEVDPSATVTARSGAFPVFREKFGRLEEVWMNN